MANVLGFSPMLGETLGNYRLISELGHGAMGAVYLAEHTLLQRKAAVKVLLPTFSNDQTMVQRFFDEARALTTIQHPGIVQVFDFGHHPDGRAYLVMEYLEGEPLGTRLERVGHLGIVPALRIAYQSASAVAAAHDAGIIHRDLKPENIFLVSDPRAEGGERLKILDFGIAKLSDEQRSGQFRTHLGTVLGTPLYMAPEQCRSASTVDHRADIYSLGCVLFHVLCGQPPFVGSSIGETIAAHLLEPPPSARSFNWEVPPQVEALLQRALAKEASDRYATMAELADELRNLIHLLGERAGTSPAFEQLPVFPGSDLVPTFPGVALDLKQSGDMRAGSSGIALSRAPTALPSFDPNSTLGDAAAQSLATEQHSRRRTGILALGFLGAAVAAVVIGFVVVGQREPARPQQAVAGTHGATPAPQAVEVVVESDPPGAAVYAVDRAEPVGTTPYTYKAPPTDSQISLRLELEGYESREVSFSASQSKTFQVALRKASAPVDTAVEPTNNQDPSITPGTPDAANGRGKRRKKPPGEDGKSGEDELLYR